MTTFCSLLKYAAAAFALSTYKSLPGAYYVRIYWVFFKNLVLAKYLKPFKHLSKSIWEVSEYSTYNSPMECDFYLHKSNSCYFEELDIARSELMTTVFQKTFHQFPTESGSYVFVPVGAIVGSFKKEIKPFESYKIRSTVHAWDSKWLYILSKFVIGKDKVAATFITKYVLKDGRKTLPPAEAVKFQGLLNDEVELQNEERYKVFCANMKNTDEIDEYVLS